MWLCADARSSSGPRWLSPLVSHQPGSLTAFERDSARGSGPWLNNIQNLPFGLPTASPSLLFFYFKKCQGVWPRRGQTAASRIHPERPDFTGTSLRSWWPGSRGRAALRRTDNHSRRWWIFRIFSINKSASRLEMENQSCTNLSEGRCYQLTFSLFAAHQKIGWHLLMALVNIWWDNFAFH